jgi:hypothetical protein
MIGILVNYKLTHIEYFGNSAGALLYRASSPVASILALGLLQPLPLSPAATYRFPSFIGEPHRRKIRLHQQTRLDPLVVSSIVTNETHTQISSP